MALLICIYAAPVVRARPHEAGARAKRSRAMEAGDNCGLRPLRPAHESPIRG